MTKEMFDAEKQYLAASGLAKNLRAKELLTDDEYSIIDTKLREKYRPIFGTLCSESAGYSAPLE